MAIATPITPGFSSSVRHLAALHQLDAQCPGQDGEHQQIGRAVEHTQRPQDSRLQRHRHEAAVGENGGKSEEALSHGIPVPDDQFTDQNIDAVDHQRRQQRYPKIVEGLRLQRPLEHHDEDTGGHHIHQQVGHGHHALVGDEVQLPQHEARADHEEQDQYLCAYREK